MISSHNSLLSSGIVKWLHPKPLIDAINGCVRVTSSCFSGCDYLTAQEYKPHGRAKEGHISIKLSNIKKAYKYCAASDIVAGSEIKAGECEHSLWRVYGLPRGLVLIGKSPDSLDCLLSGVDFFYSRGHHIFKVNPLTVGTLTTRYNEGIVNFFYLGGSPAVVDFPQFNFTKHSVQTSGSDRLVRMVKSGGVAVSGGTGLLSSACTGRFTATEAGKLDRVWEEGGCKIGVVSNSLIYADKDEKTKSLGDELKPGDGLIQDAQSIGEVVISGTDVTWVPSINRVSSNPGSHSSLVARNTYKDPGTQKFISEYRPNTANNTIIQTIKIQGGTAAELTEVEVAKIKRTWILYGDDSASCASVLPRAGMMSEELICAALRFGGCISCSNNSVDMADTGEVFIRILSAGGDTYGSPLAYGMSVYAIALELDDGVIYKVVNIFPAVIAVTHATLLVDVYINKSVEIAKKEPQTSDDLSKYWLEAEQELDVLDILDVL